MNPLQQVWDLFQDMLARGIQPDQKFYTIMTSCFIRNFQLREAERAFWDMGKSVISI